MSSNGRGRFDYVRYDKVGNQSQAHFKALFTQLDAQMIEGLAAGRAKSLAITKLEEAYMWVGKAIRDDQITRNGQAELEEDG